MGLNNEEEKGTYLNIFNGKICIRVTEDTPGAVKRTTKEGNVLYELYYPSVTGYLTSITTKLGNYGKEWILIIEDGTDRFQLGMPFSSGNAVSLLSALPNCYFDKPIKFVPWAKEFKQEDGQMKKKAYLYLHQDDVTIQWAFSKDNPGECPPLKEVVFKGEKKWDDTERMIFLEGMVRDDISLRIKDANTNRKTGLVPTYFTGFENPDVEIASPGELSKELYTTGADPIPQGAPTAEPFDDLPF